MELFPINSQQLLDEVATDFNAGNAACSVAPMDCSEYFHMLEFELPNPLLLPEGCHKWHC